MSNLRCETLKITPQSDSTEVSLQRVNQLRPLSFCINIIFEKKNRKNLSEKTKSAKEID